MEDAADVDWGVCEGGFCAVFCEFSDADDPLGVEFGDELLECFVAVGEQFGLFGYGEFIGGEVGACFGHKDQGAVVPDEESVEEVFGCFELFLCPSP